MPDTRKFNVYSTFETRIVNLGSTSALSAFNYDGIDIKGANWALRRNPLMGDLAILKNYSSFLGKGSTVIIPLCPFSALSGSYEPFEERYYSIFYPTTIPSYSYIHDVQAREKIHNPILYYPWYALFTDIWHLLIKKDNATLTEEKMESDAKSWIKNWLHEFSLTCLESDFSLVNKYNIDEAEKYLNEIIVYCKKINAEAVIIVPPMYKALARLFSNDTQEKLFCNLNRIAANHGVRFLNYMNDSAFSDERTYFKNSYLMNKKGAKAFTNKVLTDLNII